MTNAIAILRDVGCTTQDAVLLEAVSLGVAPGECICLCGPSGSGKTTVTKVLNGLIPSFEIGIERTGSVEVCGFDPAACESYELAGKVGSVFQNPKSQFYHLTSDDELAFGLENAGADVDYIEERRAKVVSEMGIEHLLGRDVSKMSGGEKQTLVFASVAIADPKVYVLDEPTANLDDTAVRTLHSQIAQVLSQGKAVIVAEHRLAFLSDLVNRAFLLEDGRIARIMTASEFTALTEEQRVAMGLRATDQSQIPQLRILPAPDADAHLVSAGLSVRGFAAMRKKAAVSSPLSFDVMPGEIVGIVGANGSGKTSLLRGLAGLEKRTVGSVYLNGEPLARGRRIKACSMVMQDVNHQLFADSVFSECELACEDEARIHETLALLDLAGLEERHPLSLSGGQKQRLAVATAMLSGRPVALFDEPTSGLDFKHMVETAELLGRLAAEGTCVVVVSHDAELLARCCTRIHSIES